jgi:hypothetical protein
VFVRDRNNPKQNKKIFTESISPPIQNQCMKWGKNKIVFLNYYQHQLKDQIAPKLTIKPLKSSFKSEFFFLKKKALDPILGRFNKFF